jgi:HlyD family secretion protein
LEAQRMTTKKKWFFITFVIFVAVCLLLYSCKSTTKSENQATVTVQKGTIKEKIIAVGNIVPKHAISVKSNISGIVGQLLHEEGEYVEQGALLLQVSPSPTPQRIAEANAEVKEQTALLEHAESHRQRLEKLLKLALETPDNYATANKDVATATAKLEVARQKLALIKNGETTIAGKSIKTMINSPISGYILQRKVDVGDPVVPLTDSQEGTVLLVIANMQDLVFKGLVNEVDVDKIIPGMTADIRVAALPEMKILGTLRKVDLQAQETTTTSTSPFNVGFNIELNNLILPKDIKLRAGYSATAEITVKEAKNVLVIPERVLIFKEGKTYVNLPTKSQPELKEIKLGISDGINAEVLAGLTAGQIVLDNNTSTKT